MAEGWLFKKQGMERKEQRQFRSYFLNMFCLLYRLLSAWREHVMLNPCAYFWAAQLCVKENSCEESDQSGEDAWKGRSIVNLSKLILEELAGKKAKKKMFCVHLWLQLHMCRNIQECRLHLQNRINYLQTKAASMWKELLPEALCFLLFQVFKLGLVSYAKGIYIV